MFRHILLLVVAVLSVTAAQDLDEFKTFNASAMQFSIELFRTALSNIRNNAMMSSISMSSVLAMLQQGAQSTTEKEITQVLHADATRNKNEYQLFGRSLKDTDSDSIKYANMAYSDFGHAPSREYESALRKYFSASTRHTNFSQKSAVANMVNYFMKVNSGGDLVNFVTPDFFNSGAQLLLANAFYLAYNWKMPFKTDRVKVRDFDIAYLQTVQVPVMRIQKEFKTGYMAHLYVQWLQIPLEEERFYLLLLLPVQIHGQDAVIEGMSSDDIFGIIDSIETVSPQLVDLYLPKFSFEIDSNFTKTLGVLGLPSVLNKTVSNLCGVSNEGIYVADVIQKATITFDENGIEFSAGTLATEKKMTLDVCGELMKNIFLNGINSLVFNRFASFPDPPLQTFSATQPFLAFVIDGQNKVPLFSARIADPSQE